MGQQCSEMRDQFTDKMLQQQSMGSNTIQPTGVDTLLADHHQQGPTKVYSYSESLYTLAYIHRGDYKCLKLF